MRQQTITAAASICTPTTIAATTQPKSRQHAAICKMAAQSKVKPLTRCIITRFVIIV